MKKSIILGMLISVVLMSCSKTKTSSLAGTYTGSGGNNTLNRVIINPTGTSNLQIQLQTNVNGTYFTFTTLQNAVASSATTLTVDENGSIVGSSNSYHFVGSGVLNGTTLTLTGSATNNSNTADVQPYYFTGSK